MRKHNLESLSNYFKEKLEPWYFYANLDYGVTGKFLKLEQDGNHLRIFFEENGEILGLHINWFNEYSFEQLYNIWSSFGGEPVTELGWLA